MFEVLETPIKGYFEIIPKVMSDLRGDFVKTIHKDEFTKLGFETNFVEQYYSTSVCGVIRGMHFQIPPAEHAKLIYSVSGAVLDVVVDLRKKSPTYLKAHSIHLSSEAPKLLYVAKGLAHGFCCLTEKATMIYNVTSAYAPEFDKGVLWSSIPIEWPMKKPIISSRDNSFPMLSDYQSPF